MQPAESGAVKKPRARKPAAERKPRAPRQKAADSKPKAKAEAPQGKLLAVVMVRGLVGARKDIADTMTMLRLDRINHCVIVPKNPNFDGMLHKARDFITWGEISQETLEKLIAKRGRFAGDKRVSDAGYVKELAHLIFSGKKVSETGIKPVFRLSPPSKGYRSTKTPFPKGSLGYRKEKINELLKRMI